MAFLSLPESSPNKNLCIEEEDERVIGGVRGPGEGGALGKLFRGGGIFLPVLLLLLLLSSSSSSSSLLSSFFNS